MEPTARNLRQAPLKTNKQTNKPKQNKKPPTKPKPKCPETHPPPPQNPALLSVLMLLLHSLYLPHDVHPNVPLLQPARKGCAS